MRARWAVFGISNLAALSGALHWLDVSTGRALPDVIGLSALLGVVGYCVGFWRHDGNAGRVIKWSFGFLLLWSVGFLLASMMLASETLFMLGIFLVPTFALFSGGLFTALGLHASTPAETPDESR